MRSRLLLLLTVGIVSFQPAIGRESKPQAQKFANIDKGDMLVSGTFSGSRFADSAGNLSTDIDVAVSWQYFLIDRLALGAAVSFDSASELLQAFGGTISSASRTYGFAPEATYYFWSADRLATYASLFARLNFNEASGQTTWSAGLIVGLDFFIYPSVALGPALQYIHDFGSTNAGVLDVNVYSFLAAFRIFL